MANLQVCFLTTTMGLAHGDILFQMIPASNKFCFLRSWAATGAASGIVTMCISMRSV